MNKNRGLVILHIDGLGYDYLRWALQQGRMPFLKQLIDEEGYQVQRYRCGVPSTTPFCQAGILYGENDEIPSFRWYDKQSGIDVSFGGFSTFRHVIHKYFRNTEALTSGGAAIATCYPDSSKASYRLGYREHGHSLQAQDFTQRRVVLNWATNPLNLLDWLRRGLWQIWKANVQYFWTMLRGKPIAKTYVIGDMLEEILLHQLTRFAVVQAMQENYPVIYGAFYAYDETGHAFGPDSDYAYRILRHIDNSIRRIAAQRQRSDPEAREYDMVILSDHGQVETVPYERQYGRHFADIAAEWLPTYEVEEQKGKRITRKGAIDGQVTLSYSGGLAHWYFKNISWRLQHDELEERFPGLIDKVANTPGIGMVLTRNNSTDIITTEQGHLEFNPHHRLSPEVRAVLGQYDDPEILAQQLHKLNSFQRSGDLIFFGKFLNHHQVNFENQIGGHGSIGGEQLFPFILTKKEWNLDTSDVYCASDLYPLLKKLRDQTHA